MKGHLKGITSVTGKEDFCESCVKAKMKKLPFKHERETAVAPLALIHSDVGGPITPQSPKGFRYWITFIDDNTRYPWIFFMKHKSEALAKFKEWQTAVEPLHNAKLKQIEFSHNWVRIFRTDNGGEYLLRDFGAHLQSCGIVHQTTAPDTPEQNGLAERMNQTLTNRALAMLIDSGLPKTYWSHAFRTASYLIARSPASGIKGQTPFEKLTGRKVDISGLRPFGCRAYSLIPKDQRTKLDSHARRCVLLGYEYASKAYTLLDVTSRKLFKSRHVVFDENPGTAPELQGDPAESIEWEQSIPQGDATTHMEALPTEWVPHDPPHADSESICAGNDPMPEADNNITHGAMPVTARNGEDGSPGIKFERPAKRVRPPPKEPADLIADDAPIAQRRERRHVRPPARTPQLVINRPKTPLVSDHQTVTKETMQAQPVTTVDDSGPPDSPLTELTSELEDLVSGQ